MMAVLAVAAAGFDAAQLTFLMVPLLLFGLLFDAAFTLARRALRGERVSAAHRTHLYQMAQRSGLGVRAVAATHWGFVLFHGALLAVFMHLPAGLKPLMVLPALAVQLGWLALVVRRMRRAGLTWAA